MSAPTSGQRRVALVLAAGFVVVAGWRGFLALQEYVAGLAITDDPSARELRDASALVELVFAVILTVHAAGAFVYTRRTATVRWAAVAAVALASGLSLVAALSGVTGSWHPVLMIVLTGGVGYGNPGQWLSFYIGGMFGCAVAWVFAASDPDPFIGLFVVIPSVVYVLIGATIGSWASRRSVP